MINQYLDHSDTMMHLIFLCIEQIVPAVMFPKSTKVFLHFCFYTVLKG